MSEAAPSFEIGGVRWWPRPGAERARLEPLLGAALAALEAGARDEKQGRRKSLYRLDLSGRGTPDHLLKVNRYAGRHRRSKSRHELALAAALASRGQPAPVPLAAGERRRGGRIEACYLLVPILPGVRDLREELGLGPAPARLRALARALGRLARELHDAGLHQDDFQPNNFLVRGAEGDGEPELFVIDFERARLRRHVPDRLRHRALAKLDRELGRASATTRLRFLAAYTRGEAAETRARWRAIAGEARALARRDEAHLYRNATRPGRRYQTLRLADFRGVALPGLDPGALERAAHRGLDAADAVSGAADGAEWSVRLERPGVAPARRALARALVLAARGLSPRPLAVLCGAKASVLLLERAERALQAHEVRGNASVEAARRVLERRLDAYGLRVGALPDPALALEPAGPGRVRAFLLDVERFAVARRFGLGGPGGRALRRHSGGRAARAG